MSIEPVSSREEAPLRPTTPSGFEPGPSTDAWARRGRRTMFLLAVAAVSALFGYALTVVSPLLLFGAILGVLAGIIILTRPYVGLILYTVTFLLRPGEVFPVLGTLHLERLVGGMTLLAIFLEQLRRDGRVYLDWSPQTRWLLAFIAAISLSIPFSYYRFGATSTLIDMLKILAFYIMVVQLVNTRRRLRAFVWVYLILVAYLGVSSLVAYYGGSLLFAQGIDRAQGLTGAGGGPNELGTSMASIFPLFVLLMVFETAVWRKVLAGMGGGLSVWALVLTGSRASILGFVAGLGYLWWMSKHKVVLGVLGVGILAAAFAVMPEQYQERYGTITSSEIDQSSQARLTTWTRGLNMLIDRTLTGVGAGCFGTAHAHGYSPESRRSWLESHSLYIQVLSELGLIGGIVFVGFVIQLLRLNRGVRRRLAGMGSRVRWEHALVGALFAGFVVLLISGFFGHSLYRRTWYVFAALGLATLRMMDSGKLGPEAE